jgi:hypothetical protein
LSSSGKPSVQCEAVGAPLVDVVLKYNMSSIILCFFGLLHLEFSNLDGCCVGTPRVFGGKRDGKCFFFDSCTADYPAEYATSCGHKNGADV